MTKKDDANISLRNSQIGTVLMIPYYLLGGPLIGFWMGGWIDQQLNTEPYFLIVLIVLGFISGMREVWRIIRLISE